ncbi:hypothetical protein GCM10023203_31250 [Actinomycetospora straminea]|uniref:MerR-like DNA binding protein n=1 Tax=Actinomycetospora straminea TaxID=663607 RepID=A0ABP9EIE2_9PSEU
MPEFLAAPLSSCREQARPVSVRRPPDGDASSPTSSALPPGTDVGNVAEFDGNAPRLTDVAVLSRLPITHVRSYQHLLEPGDDDTVFSLAEARRYLNLRKHWRR